MREQLRFFYRYPLKYRRALIVAQLVLLASMLISVAIPLIIREAIDVGVRQGQLSTLLTSAGLVILAGAFRAVLAWTGKRIRFRVSSQSVMALRHDVFAHILRLGPVDQKSFAQGQLLARLTKDVTTLRALCNGGVFEMVNQAILVGAIVVLAGTLDWWLTIVMLVPHLIVGALAVSEGQYMRRLIGDIRDHFSSLTGAVTESMRAIHVVKVFGHEEHQTRQLDALSQTLARKRARAAITQGLYGASMSMLASLSTALVLWFGAQRVAAGETTPGTVVAMMAFSMMAMMPIQGFVMGINEFFHASVPAGRLMAILATPPPIEEIPGAVDAPRLVGDVAVEHASLVEGETRILDDVTLEASPGQLVVLVGPTGGGKSALLQMMARMRDSTTGSVRIDGWDVRALTLGSLRRQVLYVPQKPWLFEGTLAENIAVSRPDAARAEIERAAREAELGGLLDRLPDGLDTRVGTQGLTFSGGERQRIGLARALLLDAPVVLLDNPTANLDAETEAQLVETILSLRADRTLVVATQSNTLIRQADRAVVVDRARVVEPGLPTAAARADDPYAALVAATKN